MKSLSCALKAHFSEYGSFHVTRGNQACHYLVGPLWITAKVVGRA